MTAIRRLWRYYVARDRRPAKHAQRAEVTFHVAAPDWNNDKQENQ